MARREGGDADEDEDEEDDDDEDEEEDEEEEDEGVQSGERTGETIAERRDSGVGSSLTRVSRLASLNVITFIVKRCQ